MDFVYTEAGKNMIDRPRLGPTPGDDFADRIQRLRAEIGLTQQALADRLGVSFATVNRWENKPVKTLQAILGPPSGA